MPWSGLIQLSGLGLCSAVLPWLLDAQAQCEPIAWVGSEASLPFAPDLVGAGLDLSRLLWVRPDVGPERARVRSERTLKAQLRATELLLRSGAFGCVVVDLGENAAEGWARKASWQSRIAMLARKHLSAVLLLTYDDAETSLGALVNVRIRYVRGEGRVLRNKTSVPVAQCLLRLERDDPDGVLFARTMLKPVPKQKPCKKGTAIGFGE